MNVIEGSRVEFQVLSELDDRARRRAVTPGWPARSPSTFLRPPSMPASEGRRLTRRIFLRREKNTEDLSQPLRLTSVTFHAQSTVLVTFPAPARRPCRAAPVPPITAPPCAALCAACHGFQRRPAAPGRPGPPSRSPVDARLPLPAARNACRPSSQRACFSPLHTR